MNDPERDAHARLVAELDQLSAELVSLVEGLDDTRRLLDELDAFCDRLEETRA